MPVKRQSRAQKQLTWDLEEARLDTCARISALAERIMLADNDISVQAAFDNARAFAACEVHNIEMVKLSDHEVSRITANR